MFTLNLNFDKRDLKKIEQMPDEFKDGLLKGIKNAMLFAEAEAKKSFDKPGNLQARTGHLRRSITSDVDKVGDRIVGKIGSNVVYARIHELGGVIRPKVADYLRFQINNKWVTTKKVTMPARPYLRPSIEDNLKEITEIVRNSVIKEVNDER